MVLLDAVGSSGPKQMDHHYVPQFYTRRWTDSSGKVLCYRRIANGQVTPKPLAPKGTGYHRNLYASPPAIFWESHDAQTIENDFFAPIDNDAAVVLDKLQNGGASSLTDGERTAWALFMNSMLHRHRDDILERDAKAPELAAEVRARFLAARRDPEDRKRVEKALADLDVNQLARTTHRTLMVQAIRDPRALHAIKSLAWEVIAVNPGVPLITTDRPVLVNLGQGRPGLELMTLPLSPARLFVAYPSHWRNADGTCIDGVAELLENVTFGHDLLLLNEQRCRFVYTSKRLEDVVSDGRVVRMGLAVEDALQRWPE